MEQYFAVMFEVVRHERSLILILSLTDPDLIKPVKFTYHEINIVKLLALEKINRQRIFKGEVAIALLKVELEEYFLFDKRVHIQT